MEGNRRLLASAALAAWLGLGCGTETPPRPAAGEERPAVSFSGEAALERLGALERHGPRPSGSGAAEKLRDHLMKELRRLDLDPSEWKRSIELPGGRSKSVVHVVARVPGTASSDAFLLATPYTGGWSHDAGSPCEHASHGGSGVALLLEAAKVLVGRPLPYETWLAFVDEGPAAEGALPAGSLSLARALEERGELDRIRLAVFVSRVGEVGLRVPRDLRSHRTFRERFYQVARELGFGETFPNSAGFESSLGGHQAFLESGSRQVVALIGRNGARPPPAIDAGPSSEDGAPSDGPRDGAALREVCSAASLHAVGRVKLAALEQLGALLVRLDRLGGSPE